ncbi:interferon-induced very large GTPase 1-like [Apostichopus japonicus]|uniref:interferon-induced very large GTPase 1-like n=1 Tax=Stichopus japonicus TaxID=307972 RepID=UPI003AB7815F
MASKRKCSLPEGEEQSKCAKKSHDESKTDDRIYAFRVMLDKLGQHLDATHVERIVYLEGLSAMEKEEIQNSPAALFQLLESKQKLNVDDVSRLKENLQTIEHMAAVKLLDEYQHHDIDDFPPEPDYNDAEDDHNRTVTFDDILKMLGLEDKFPGKLQLEDFLRVRRTVESTQTVYSFWQKITCLDYQAGLPQSRSMISRVQYSMRDFIFAVLHCSDNFLRQDILEKMSACQLAVPLLLSGIKSKKQPIFLRWACRRILKKWKGARDLFAIEQPIISHSIFTVSVLRIGEIGMSKSQLLNHMIGPCQGSGAHPYFLTNDLDTVSSKFSLGSIESIWFLPTSANKNEIFKNAMAFLNLRGDCSIHPTQREFACTAANLTIVFVPTDERHNFVEVIRDVKKKSCQTLFIAVKDPMGPVEQLQHDRNWTFVKGLHVKTLSKYICQEIETICDKNDGKISSLCDFDAQNVDIDENITHIKTAQSAVNNIFHNAKDQDVIKFKNENFKLQKAWKKLIQLDKERFSFDNQDGTTFEQKRSKDKTIIKEYREAQLQCQLSDSVQCYLNSVKNVSDQETFVKYFLGILHDKIFQIVSTNTHVDWKTIFKLEEKIRQYKTSHPETGNCDDQTGHQGRALKDYESSVEECNKLHASCKVKNLGCEHFLREIGQQYEAYKEACCVRKTSINSSEFPLYPSIAAQLILQMHSFELMDGDTGCVPITWVTAVLDTLTQKLSNPKVLVLSVIGVQSSGKSTLLNSMFGLRFPVRAGRCTRGLFIRLLKVEEIMAAKLGFDYLIVVDTEGLRSIDHDDHRFDNELVTFALSISNVGIFNIGGENIGHDMVGVLQIAAHALMRMKEVDLKSRCKIVQQRVSDITSGDMNKSNTNSIKVTLDEATRYAAEEEGLEGRYSQFSDVVDLRVDVDMQTIPCLWTGGMSPPNPLYAEKVAKIREGLFDDIETQMITTELTLSTFTERVRNVWKAVKEENFVFNFQDSVRAVDFNQLCLHYNVWLIQMRQSVRKKSEEVLTRVSIESADLKSLIEEQIEESKKTLKKKLDDYLTNHQRRNIISKHRQNFLGDIDITMKEVKNQTDMRLTEEIEIRNLERNPPKLNGEWLVKAISDVNEIVPNIRVEIGEAIPLQPYNQYFQKYLKSLWSNWTKDIKIESGIIRTLNITDLQSLCEKLLLRVTRDMAVGSEIKNLLSHEGGIKNHVKLPDCSKYINEKYLKVWIIDKEMSKKRDYLSKETCDQQSVEQDLIIQQKSRIVDAFVQSVISSRISEVIMERKRSFDSNLFQLMVRKALLELSTKSDGIKLPPTLIAKVLLHLSSKSVKNVFGNAHVCADDFRDFYGDEENVIRLHLFHVINYSDPAVSAANFIYHFIKAVLTKKADSYNISEVHQIKRVQLPWDLLEFMSSDGIDQHQYMYGIDTSLIMPSLSAIVNSYVMHQNSIISNKLSNVWRNSMTTKLVTLEQTHSIGSYKEWTKGLVRECNIDPCIVSTDELFREPNHILVSKYLQRHVAQWESDVIINVSDIQVAAGLTYVCDETCPMCGVFCDNVMKSHQIHSSHLHRPRGMAGETYSGSNHLVIEDCNVSISLPTASFTNAFGNIILCKCYKKSFPDWEIQPLDDYPGKQFWQWVFASKIKMFAGVFGKSTELIPNHWYFITKEAALNSLQVDKTLKTEGRRMFDEHMPWWCDQHENYDLPFNEELLRAVPGTSRSGNSNS